MFMPHVQVFDRVNLFVCTYLKNSDESLMSISQINLYLLKQISRNMENTRAVTLAYVSQIRCFVIFGKKCTAIVFFVDLENNSFRVTIRHTSLVHVCLWMIRFDVSCAKSNLFYGTLYPIISALYVLFLIMTLFISLYYNLPFPPTQKFLYYYSTHAISIY